MSIFCHWALQSHHGAKIVTQTQAAKDDFIQDISWLRREAIDLGFGDIRVSDTDLSVAGPRLKEWLDAGRHGDMNYMRERAHLRLNPQELQPGTVRILTVRMDYLPDTSEMRQAVDWRNKEIARWDEPSQAVVAMYARGRDYHKVLRQRLQSLADVIEKKIGSFGYRVFVDSGPVMEVELANKSGLGWRGKHTLLLNREAGSMFFLGEILVDVPFPVDEPITSHCGECSACINICPTQAITAPYQLDARRCISYLTIEHQGFIPEELRPLMGNRVYGCDDCQLVCPWNKFAQLSSVPDFLPRHGLEHADLLNLWSWSEEDFLSKHEGSPIRRIGYEAWRRNLAVGMGNALRSETLDSGAREKIIGGLKQVLPNASDMLKEHIEWALMQASKVSK
ncbi:tRNA epoxyqueuosine(34) reductase QueG [Polynucleobacter sp. AM-26B4]|uniref:tRNA epoxyqueuosine(34) reductase QueG n=1 Tax=Polynucleobacter sp. AM-26B4 TaxID=2689103 RepID=UPI001C0B0A09|nr:tRNA epoxyqueuosine(34) reductase QueG [Polynucleobacter sp. AM-26B4]MBU3585060.1 tRNA epoxyqueuosine(34) reductase QueG [Polynucleobacter sp. AM-26B4]